MLGESKTGGISLLSLLLFLAGLACIAIQVVLLTSGQWKEMKGIAPFVTGLVGLALVVFFAWTGLRRGEIRVYVDRVEGKSKSGRKYSFPLADLGEIDLRSNVLLLRGKDGKPVMTDSPPQDRRLRGLIWLLLHHDLPSSVWEQFPEAMEEGMTRAVRMFLNESGEAEFMDQGMLIATAMRHIYLPVQDTVPALAPVSAEKSLSTSLQASRLVMKFDPNPGDLPLANLAAALLAAPLEEKLRLSHFEMLAEAHGGAFLEEGEEGKWEGETSGWKVEVRVL